jgi:hypothetical protein
VEQREFAVFWSDRHIGTYQQHATPKQLKLPGVAMDAEFVGLWQDAFPDAPVIDWRRP